MSEQAKPTPGPWTWRETTSPGSSIGDLYLTDVRLGGGEGGHLRVLAADAVDAVDARLIAAAPDLLAACRLWDEGFTEGEQFDADQFLRWVNANRRAAREAIAKATGT